jgi:hypothetical protein
MARYGALDYLLHLKTRGYDYDTIGTSDAIEFLVRFSEKGFWVMRAVNKSPRE